MKKLKNRFKNIKPQTLLTHVIVTLLYPLARVVMASSQRLLVFTDCLTIVAAILLIAGVVYSLYLHGDFDISSYVMRRARGNAPKQTFEAYKANPTGYFDSVELFALDTIIGGKGLNNFDLVMTLTGNSAEAIDWLATKNAHLTNVGSFGGASVKRIHRATTEDGKTTPVGAYLVKVLTADVEAEDKIDLRTNTAATEIVMEDGKAVGVKVKNENGEYTIRAKAVILASGGFGADLDRVAALKPALAGFVTTNVSTVTGDGIDMAVAVGAATVTEQAAVLPLSDTARMFVFPGATAVTTPFSSTVATPSSADFQP